MSRIHEALQMADRERKNSPASATPDLAAAFPGLPPDAHDDFPASFSPAAPARSDARQDAYPAPGALNLHDIRQMPWTPSKIAFPTLEERGETVEQFRGLRSRIYELRYQDPLKTILVSSGMPAEGKTFVAANLAVSLARNKNNGIVLIDADLRRPSLNNILGAPNTPGLSEYLAGSADLKDILQRSQPAAPGKAANSIPNLYFIPAGVGGDNSSELVAGHRVEELIAQLSAHFDWIIIDTPPVLAFADAVDLARAADAVLLVARGASTPFDVAQRAQAAFANSRLLGFVLNAVKDAPKNGSYYYYGSYGADR